MIRISKMKTPIKILISGIILVMILIVILNTMDAKHTIKSLDTKIRITDIIAICAIVATLIGAIFSFYFRSKQNDLLKIEKEKDKVIIEDAKRDASLANEKSSFAVKDAAIAFEKASLVYERATKAELRSKELEIELLKLRLAVGDRYLPDNVAAILSNMLKKYSNKKVIILCSIANNKEPQAFSDKLNNFFNSIGWHSQVIQQNNISIPAPTGMDIIANEESNKIIAQIIFEQFKSLNYECNLRIDHIGQSDLVIRIFAH
jgi:hypothetical protein